MPKEHKKRGRRDEKKRQRADEEEVVDAKRQKLENHDGEYEEHEKDQSTQVFDPEDYIPLESSRGTEEFYGLLDDEEQAYFKSADQMLELDQFATADERSLFLESVWNEARGKELKLASSQSSSRLMEKLIQLSTADQLKTLFGKFGGHFLSLVQHRFASHCCEALFLRSAPVVTEEIIAGVVPTTQEGTGVKAMEDLFLQVLAELDEYMGYLMTDKFASHVVRVLLVVFSGHSLEEASKKSLLRGPKKERIGAGYTGNNESKETMIRSVPSSFSRALEETVAKMIGQLDSNYLRSFATQPLGSPVLQLLLEIEFGKVGRDIAKDEHSLFRKLLPEVPPLEGSVSARFVRGLLYDPIGSHLLETIITCSPGKVFKSIYNGQFRDNLKSIVRNETASYVLNKALERLSAEDLQGVLEQIEPEIPSLISDSRTSVLRTLIERFHVRRLRDDELGSVFRRHYSQSNPFTLEKTLGLLTENQRSASQDEKSQGNDQNINLSHASLLLQKMLEYPGSLREIVNEAIEAAGPVALVAALHDKSATYVVQSALVCQDQSQKFRRMLLQKFSRRARELALDHVSSYVFDAFWKATSDLRFIRERLAQELARDEEALRESRSGRVVWRSWLMDLFTNKRKSWIEKSKELDDGVSSESAVQATANHNRDKKTSLDKARAKFASRKATEGRRIAKAPRKGGEHQQISEEETLSRRTVSGDDSSTGKNTIRMEELSEDVNGVHDDRAGEIAKLLGNVQDLIIPFIRNADKDANLKPTGQGLSLLGRSGASIVEQHSPKDLQKLLQPSLPTHGLGTPGLLQAVESTLRYSVNTFDRGFLDKLYAATDAPGIASELVLATLNTNVHVYAVSPALTIIEKEVTRALASLFGLRGEHSGGVSVQGGAASNMTSILIARNTMFPITKTQGMASLPTPLVLFTSSEAHYSISSAAASLGIGTSAVRAVPIDENGAMSSSALETMIEESIASGHQPFYVCATAGTTVRGAYDPLLPISKLTKKYGIWLHVDAAWGGPAIFSAKHKWKLEGSEFAQSIACNPHKMMGLPLTCSFLLGEDLRKFHSANALSAGYLFHEPDDVTSAPAASKETPAASEIFDLASLTPQCGRRGDSLKLYLSWIFHGSEGYERQINAAFEAAAYLADCVSRRGDMLLVSQNPPPCCQVCFYYIGPKEHTAVQGISSPSPEDLKSEKRLNSKITRGIVTGLVPKGWMVDYAPGERGEFLRVVTNRGTTKDIVDGLVKAISDVGIDVISMK